MFNIIKNLLIQNESKPDSLSLSIFGNHSLEASTNEKLYNVNPYVRASISMIATSVASMPFKIYKNGKFVKEHVLYDLLRRPNGEECWNAFAEGCVTNYLLHGNAYVFFGKNEINSNNPKKFELHNLSSDRMEIVVGPYGVPKAYKYTVNGTTSTYVNNDKMPFIGRFKSRSANDIYGKSVVDCIKQSATLYDAITTYQLAVLSNGGRPSGIVTCKKHAGAITAQEKKDMENKIRNEYAGAHNAGKIALFEGGDISWTPMGDHNITMHNQTLQELAEAMCIGAGVQPSLIIGSTSSKTSRANLKEMREHFYECTAIPIGNKLYNFLNNWLVPKIDPQCTIKMNLDDFLPLYERRLAMIAELNKIQDLTPQERRILLGLDKIEEEAEMSRSP
jgi:HK97 family phage portal protein